MTLFPCAQNAALYPCPLTLEGRMGMAGAAPMDTYRRRFGITTHATERYRERAGEWLRERGHLDDSSVGNSLDARISEAWDAERYHDVLDEGEPARIVDLESKELGRLYAVVKPSRGTIPWTVVTVLTGEMHDSAWTGGRWQAAPEPLKAPTPPAAPVRQAPRPSPPEPASFLLRWEDEDGPQERLLETRTDVRTVAAEVATDGGKSLRLYAEVPLKVRVEVDF